ncbi:hypothetical protein ABUD82_002977 [Listeria monocytogenes]
MKKSKVGGFLFKYISCKLYQKWFCKQYVKRSESSQGYERYLKHISKKDSARGDFIHVSIYDVLDNDGMNKLIKKIYKLKKDEKYTVHTYYLKNNFKKLNYINSNLAGTITGRIGEIKFNNDNWFSELSVSYTYVNNSEAVIQYCFTFKKVMCTYLQIHNFVLDNILKVSKPWFFHSYADKKIIKKAGFKELFRLDGIFFADILQSYICNLLYTNFGKKYKLPIEYSCKIYRNNKKKSRLFRNVFLNECYEKKNTYLIVNTLDYDRFEVAHYYSGKYFSNSILLSYFAEFSMEMYYKAFMSIELHELEIHMRKYLNSRRNIVSSKDMKWLINKVRYVKEQDEKISYALDCDNSEYTKNLLGWTLFINGKNRDEDFINYPNNTKFFKDKYTQNLEYLNSIASVQNDKIVIIVTVITLFLTIASVIISIF